MCQPFGLITVKLRRLEHWKLRPYSSSVVHRVEHEGRHNSDECLSFQITWQFGDRSVDVMVKDIGAEGLGFDSRAGQIGPSLANGSLPLRRFFGAALPRRQVAEMDTKTSRMLRRNIARMTRI